MLFKNSGVTVAYQDDVSIPAIRNSKVGDHVMICLVFIPKNCPKGDDRGKMYTVRVARLDLGLCRMHNILAAALNRSECENG